MHSNRIVSWRGKPIEQLTREELVDALEFVSNQLRKTLERNMKKLLIILILCSTGPVYASDDKTIYEAAIGVNAVGPTTVSLCIGYDLRCYDERVADCEYVEGLIAGNKKLSQLEKSLTFNLTPDNQYCGRLIPMSYHNEEKTCLYLLSEKWVCKDNGEGKN